MLIVFVAEVFAKHFFLKIDTEAVPRNQSLVKPLRILLFAAVRRNTVKTIVDKNSQFRITEPLRVRSASQTAHQITLSLQTNACQKA